LRLPRRSFSELFICAESIADFRRFHPGDAMRTVNSVQRRDWLALAAILLVAALLRLGEPGIVEFKHDEAMLSLMAQDMVSGKGIPLTGIPSSVGVPNPPISVYILAVPYALSSSPLFATMFIAALNIIGAGLLWWIARRYVGRTAALIASLAYAVNPWAILYSRKIWAQDFHSPLVLLAIALGLYGFIEGKRWAQIACLPVLIIALQIHFAAWALLPLYLWFLWAGRKRLSWKVLAVSVFLGILTVIPFLIGLSNTLAQDPNRLTNAIRPQGSGLSLSADALRWNGLFAAGIAVETQVAPGQTLDLLEQIPRPDRLWWIVGALSLMGLCVVIGRRHPLAGLLVLWALFPIVIFTPTWTATYPHYFIASIPAFCLLAGIGSVFLIERFSDNRVFQYAALAVLAIIFVSQSLWWRGVLHYVDTTDTTGGFGNPLHFLMDIRDQLSDSKDVVVISNGMDLIYNQEAAVWPVMLHGSAQCIRILSGQGMAVLPAAGFAALTAPNAPENAVNNLYRQADETTFLPHSGGGAYTLGFFPDGLEWPDRPFTTITPAHFGSGAHLIGYSLYPTRLYLEWLLPGPVDADFHYFGHYLDSTGEKRGQADSVLLPGRSWCKDDRLVTWSSIELPPDTVTLRVGLYTLQGGRFVNDSLLDADENPVSTWIDIPLSNR
jgi:hypothetical protein